MTDNFWPDLDEKINTQCVFDFIRTLTEQIKEKYNGKIKCSLEEISYKTYGISTTQRSIRDIAKLLGPVEENGLIEKDKIKASIRVLKEYKFMLYNDNYFFRVFDLKIGEYFPVEIRPAEEIENKEHKYEEFYSDNFVNQILSIIHTKTIKDVIRFMIEL